MRQFVDKEEIDSRYWETPYYLVPDGDVADEGYAIMARALAETGKVAIGQLIRQGHEHLVAIKALKGGLMLSILRYRYELREPKTYFEDIRVEAKPEALGLAKELIEAESGRFEPEKIPDKYAETLRELLRAKVEERAPHIEVATEGKAPEVITISWTRLKRVCRRRDALRCETRCGSAWANLRTRKAKTFTATTKPASDGALISIEAGPPTFRRTRWHCCSIACQLSCNPLWLAAVPWSHEVC
jgi:DNA end-binding protein Ku